MSQKTQPLVMTWSSVVIPNRNIASPARCYNCKQPSPYSPIMTPKAQPLARALGAEITGVDLTQELPRDQIVELSRLLVEHQVLFFRQQRVTPEQQANFAARFGTLHIHPIYP